MILKTIKKENYNIEDSTEKESFLQTFYYDNIDHIERYLPLEHNDSVVEYLKMFFYDGKEISLVLRTLEIDKKCSGEVWVDNFSSVFLMNNEGKTIERIV